MAKTPTPEDIQLPGIQGPRPVAGYDVSPLAAGGQALARGTQQLGAGIEQGANQIAEAEMYRARNATLLAQHQANAEASDYTEQVSRDPSTTPEVYAAGLSAIKDKYRANVPPGPLQDHYEAMTAGTFSHQHRIFAERYRTEQSQNLIAGFNDESDELINRTQYHEDPIHDSDSHNFLTRVQIAKEQGQINPNFAERIMRKTAQGIYDTHALRGLRDPATRAEVMAALEDAQTKGFAPFEGISASGGFTLTGTSTGGASNAASVVAKGETGDPSLGTKAVGNISSDTNGSKSYGFMGLNSGTGSVQGFVRQYGQNFGLTAPAGSRDFDAQWHAAAQNQSGDFRNAQLRYFNERIVPSIATNLQSYGVPANVASDPRVQTYFADRSVQMGTIGLHVAQQAWQNAGGDPVKFLRNMNQIDGRPENLQANFHSAIASGVYGERGHETRLNTRLAGALAAGQDGAAQGGATPGGVIPAAMPQQGGGLAQGQPPSGNAYRDLLPPHRIEALLTHGRALENADRTDARTRLENGVADDVAAAAREGYIGTGRTRDDFVSVYGQEQGEEKFKDYSDRLQLGMDAHNMKGATPEEQDAYIAAHAPVAGQPGYAKTAERQDQLISLRNRLDTARNAADTKQRKAAIGDLTQRSNDDALEAANTGKVTKGIMRPDFINALGEEDGAAAWNAYTNSVQYAVDAHNMNSKDAEGQSATAELYRPQAGQAGQKEAYERYAGLLSIQKDLAKKLQDDPAAYVLNNMPAAQSAWTKLQSSLSDQAATPDARQGLARDYAHATMIEQERLGVPEDQVRLVPKSYVDGIKQALVNAQSSDDPAARTQLIQRVQSERAVWGDAWPQVVRQLAPEVTPTVRAIAAGADPAAMTRLLSLPKDMTVSKIVGEQNETKVKDVAGALNTEMQPFQRTLVGRQLDRDYPGYYGLAEKLAALGVRDGKSASDAAHEAFNALIGNRYDFRDTYRIPKSAAYPADDIQAGAQAARLAIAQSATGANALDIKPAVNDIGISDPRGDSLSKFARDGVWVTANDNTGLNLVYGDKFVRRSDGSPLKLTWEDLAKRGGTPEARRKAIYDQGAQWGMPQ
jgi:hypothetical protein